MVIVQNLFTKKWLDLISASNIPFGVSNILGVTVLLYYWKYNFDSSTSEADESSRNIRLFLSYLLLYYDL
jgi:hypothetical protein